MADYFLQFFGGPLLVHLGSEVPLSPAHSSLLSLVAGEGSRGLLDTTIQKTMWRDDVPSSVLGHRLSQACYGVNRRAGARLLLRRSGRCWADPGLLRTDLAAFERAILDGDVAAAMVWISQGFLCPTEAVADDPLLDWILAKRVALRASVRRTALSSWSCCAAAGDWKAATTVAEALLELDPIDETTLQRLLRSRAMSGGVQEAQGSYAEFRERFELGGASWRPSAATLQLLARLNLPEPHNTTATAESSDGQLDPPLTGREAELRTVRASIQSAFPLEMDVLLLSGEAGMGKTRLLREALGEQQLSGVRVLLGTSSELEREILLNPLLDAISVDSVMASILQLPEPWRTVFFSLLPQLHTGEGPVPEPPPVRPDATPRRLFEAFRILFLHIRKCNPIILVIEDFHWIDDTSLAVLEYLRRRWKDGGFRVVVSVRPEDLNPSSRPAKWLDDIRAKGLLTEIPLAELDSRAARELLDKIIPANADRSERERLCFLSGRNPYFVIELVTEWKSGRLPLVSQLPDVVLPVPFSIRQVFERRLSSLSPVAERCASFLAILDEPVSARELSRLARVSRVHSVLALRELGAHRLVEWSSGGVRLRHALVRQTIRGQFDPVWQSWLHGRVAGSLLARDPSAMDRLALHFHRAGRREQALSFALRAAEKAERAGAVPEALGFYLLSKENATDGRLVAEILGKIGHLHYIHRDFEKAKYALALAAEQFRELGSARHCLRLLIQRADARSHLEGEETSIVLGELRALSASASEAGYLEELAEALDVEVHLLDRMERTEEVIAVLEQATKLLAVAGQPEARSALNRVLSLHLYYGDRRQALAAGRAAVSEARKAGPVDFLLNALNRLAVVLLHLGQLESPEGLATLAEAEALSSSSGDLFLRYNILLNGGVWALDTGDLDRAEVAFARAAQVVRMEPDLTHLVLSCNMGELRLAQGQIKEAEGVFLAAKTMFRSGMPAYLEGVIDAGLGICALEFGRLQEAQGIALRLPEPPARWFFDPSVVVIFQARLLDRLGNTAAALRLLEAVCDDLADRLITAWIKLRVEHHRIAVRRGMAHRPEFGRTLAIAAELGLDIRKGQILRLMGP